MPNVLQATPVVVADDTDLSNDFDAVFDSITNGTNDDENSDTKTADGAADAAGDAAQPGESGDGAGDSGEPAEPGGDPAAADGAGQSADAGDDAAGGDQGDAAPVDYAAQIAALTAQLAALQVAPAAAPAAAAEPTKDVPVYSETESTELAALQKDWPELKRMFELMARQTEVNVVKYTFNEMGKILSPLQQSVSVITGNDHVDAIYSAHADYDQAYNPCMEWIDKQPGFLKNTYQNIVKNGTSDEVVTMMQKFKDETKWTAAPAAAAGAAPAGKAAPKAQSKAQLSDAAKQAAQAIGAVGTKRGGAHAAQDPMDFDGAWEEAVASK